MPSPKISTFREITPLIYSWTTPDIPKYDGLGEDRVHRAGERRRAHRAAGIPAVRREEEGVVAAGPVHV